MASSPTDGEETAFRLSELVACWDQAYGALARGDLERVADLMAIADHHLEALGSSDVDSDELRELGKEAATARGRLEHGMKAGLEGLRAELRQAREGSRALQGYRLSGPELGSRVEHDA